MKCSRVRTAKAIIRLESGRAGAFQAPRRALRSLLNSRPLLRPVPLPVFLQAARGLVVLPVDRVAVNLGGRADRRMAQARGHYGEGHAAVEHLAG